MFHPVTSFVSLLECVPAHTHAFSSVSKSQFCIEVSSSFVICCVLLDDVMVRISRVCLPSRVREDTLISLMRWRLTTIVVEMARSLMYSVSIINLPPLLVQHDTNAVFVVVSSCTHEYVFVMCPIFLLCHASTFHITMLHPIGSLRARKFANHFFDSFT